MKKQEGKLGWEVDPAPQAKLVEVKTRVRLLLVKHARTFPAGAAGPWLTTAQARPASVGRLEAASCWHFRAQGFAAFV